MATYLVDIDGTVADCEHRRMHVSGPVKDWDRFFAASSYDKPVLFMLQLLTDLKAGGARIVYVSGRPERLRQSTGDWLDEHGFPWGKLYMRKDGDRRPDTIVKAEILAAIRERYSDIVMSFDDRDSVVEMWRDNGVPCAQVARGDF